MPRRILVSTVAILAVGAIGWWVVVPAVSRSLEPCGRLDVILDRSGCLAQFDYADLWYGDAGDLVLPASGMAFDAAGGLLLSSVISDPSNSGPCTARPALFRIDLEDGRQTELPLAETGKPVCVKDPLGDDAFAIPKAALSPDGTHAILPVFNRTTTTKEELAGDEKARIGDHYILWPLADPAQATDIKEDFVADGELDLRYGFSNDGAFLKLADKLMEASGRPTSDIDFNEFVALGWDPYLPKADPLLPRTVALGLTVHWEDRSDVRSPLVVTKGTESRTIDVYGELASLFPELREFLEYTERIVAGHDASRIVFSSGVELDDRRAFVFAVFDTTTGEIVMARLADWDLNDQPNDIEISHEGDRVVLRHDLGWGTRLRVFAVPLPKEAR